VFIVQISNRYRHNPPPFPIWLNVVNLQIIVNHNLTINLKHLIIKYNEKNINMNKTNDDDIKYNFFRFRFLNLNK